MKTTRPFLLAILFVASLAFTSCKPPPRPSPDTPAVTPSSWTDTARTVLSTLAWALPAAHVVTDAILPDPARTIVGRALDADEAPSRERLATMASTPVRVEAADFGPLFNR
jgi:hypothetical protein